MEIENVENLAERCAQLIMQQRRKYAGPQADGGLWQSVGNDQFNGFATFAYGLGEKMRLAYFFGHLRADRSQQNTIIKSVRTRGVHHTTTTRSNHLVNINCISRNR